MTLLAMLATSMAWAADEVEFSDSNEDIQISVEYGEIEYCGVALEPTVTVKYNFKKGGLQIVNDLVNIVYTNNINAGLATITITGKGSGTTMADPGQSNKSYYFSENSVTRPFTITKKDLTITADDKTKTYGEEEPTYTFSSDDLVEADAESVITCAVEREEGEDVDDYDITPTAVISIMNGETDVKDNYNISFADGTLTINKKNLTITADDDSKIYGEDDPESFTVSADLIDADAESVITCELARAEGEAVGTYAITVTTPFEDITITNGDKDVTGNYNITECVDGTFSITTKDVTITAKTQVLTYGTALGEGATYATLANAVEGHTLSAITLTASGTTVTTNGTITPSNAVIIDENEDDVTENYAITYVQGALVINPALLTVKAEDKEKEYGEVDPELTFVVTGLKYEETVETAGLTFTCTREDADAENYAGEQVGTYTITPSGEELQGNYQIVETSFLPGTLTINQAPLTVKADNKEKIYNAGAEDPEWTATVTGWKFEDADNADELISYTFSREEGEDVLTEEGAYYTITPSGAASQGNYSVTYQTGEFIINPITDLVTVTITGHTATVDYDGTLKTVEGYDFAADHPLYIEDFYDFYGTAEITSITIGTSTITLEESEFANITPNFTNVEFNVGTISLTINCYETSFADNADNTNAINKTINEHGGWAVVTLADRTFYKDGDWNTICVPFDVDLTAENCPLAGADVRALSDVSFTDGTLTMEFTEEGEVTALEAGVPYILKWANDTENPTITNPVFAGVGVKAASNDQTFDLGNGKSLTFKGTYQKLSYGETDKSILLVGEGSTLYYPEAGAFVGAQRAYFLLEGIEVEAMQSNAIGFRFGDATRINNVLTPVSSAVYYDLSGRCINGQPTEAGIYIVNGKKVVIK